MRWSVSLVIALFLVVPSAADNTVRLTVHEPSGVSRAKWPVTSGIPIAQGDLLGQQSDQAALFAADGSELPLQTEVLARWPDGSVRWLLLDFQIDLAAHQTKTLDLRYGANTHRRTIEKPVHINQLADSVTIDTGPMRCAFSGDRFRLFDAVWLDLDHDGQYRDSEQLTQGQVEGIVLRGPDGTEFRADAAAAQITVEQAGPMRACVRIAGHHASADGTMFGYVVRVHAYRGKPYVRCFYSFNNDWPRAVMAKVDALNLVFAASPVACGSSLLDGQRGDSSRIFQVDDQHFLRDGKPAGQRAAGWAALSGPRAGLAVGLREFWQNWPKSIETTPDRIVLGICPHFEPGRYDDKPLREEAKLYYALRDGVHTFKCGVSRTHEFWTTFFAGKADADQLATFFHATEDPLLATCDPEYVSQTRAAGTFPPADPDKYGGYDAWFARTLDAHLRRRDKVHEYGMLNFGDWYGERGVNWGNLEYDLAHGLFLQYLRTGDRRYYLRAEQAARHHIDVDVVHATNKQLKNPWGEPPRVGDIWLHCVGHTGGYYLNAPLPVDRTYQMGHSTNFGHVWISGDLNYYFLTGDRRARNVALRCADAMVAHMPTRYGTHIRTLGWPMILVLDAYQATGDPKYLDAAKANWQVLEKEIDWERGWVVHLAAGHCLHKDRRCYGNVPFMEGLTLCALARYHSLSGDPEVLRALTVGIDQMIRECWHEDVQTFSYTACPLSSHAPYGLFMLSTEAMAYEIRQTGNKTHRRILREGVKAALAHGNGSDFGKSFAQMIFFTPHALETLEAE